MNQPIFESISRTAHADSPVWKSNNSPQTLPIEFTGTGSEYFRIWAVNLLLTLLTLTLYTPWARARKLRYFHSNTLVGGHALAFHGDPQKMFRGYLLVGAMVVAYSVAGQFSPTAGVIAFVILALVSPALLKSSLQFRLANTRWRGLRFGFAGTVRGAYGVMWPILVPIMGLLGLGGVVQLQQRPTPPDWFAWAWFSMILCLILIAPWLWWRFKKYQHDHCVYAGLQTRFKASVGSFYSVFLKTVGVSAACWVAVTVLAGAVVLAVAASTSAMKLIGAGLIGLSENTALVWLAMLAYPLLAIGAAAVYGVWIPYFTSRMQNLVWSNTGNREFRFQSDLTFRSALKLTIKNWLLIGLTLGLYWPFAAVAMARLKLQAMAVLTRVDPQALISRGQAHEGEAAGDAAGDLFGVDVGL